MQRLRCLWVTYYKADQGQSPGGNNERQKLRDLADVEAYREQTLEAAELLKSTSRRAFELGLAALPAHAQEWWQKRNPEVLPPFLEQADFSENSSGLVRFIKEKVLPWCDRCRQALEESSMVNAKAFEATIEFGGLEKLDRYEVALAIALEPASPRSFQA